MKGFVYVDAEGTKSEADLEAWVHRGIDFASTLPEKIRELYTCVLNCA